MTTKTNAARQLDRLGITYRTSSYDVAADEFSAARVAMELGLPAGQVFKTLAVVCGEHPCLAVVPGDLELRLKALARASGQKRAAMVPLSDVKKLTGYERGSVTALAPARPLNVYLDEHALGWEEIAVSGGTFGFQIVLSPADFVAATGAIVATLC